VVVDPTAWGRRPASREAPRYLEALQHAVVEGEQVNLGYATPNKEPTTRIVHPLGLATKGPVWYLVADTEAGLRTFRVERVTAVETTGEAVVRPDGFDLEEAWRLITERVDSMWAKGTGIEARGAASPDSIQVLRMVFGPRLRIGPTRPDGRVDVEVGSESVPSLAGQLAGFGADIEVFEPAAVRERLAQIATELAATYVAT
jgi:predicted DNA-binding transcriptional regulator YafY